MLPLAQLSVEQLFQFLSGKVHGGGFGDKRIDEWLQPVARFLAGEYFAFADDENTAARTGFDESIASKVRVSARDGVRIEDKFLSQGTHAGKLLTDAGFSRGDSQPHVVSDLFVDRRTRTGADGEDE